MNTHKYLLKHGYSTDDPAFGHIARRAHNLINNEDVAPEKALQKIKKEIGEPEEKLEFSDNPQLINVYGEVGNDIDTEAYKQLEKACRLPVAIAGALLPDGQVGYALPVGGVIALENAVSPAFVGFDIACRMKMSILDIPVADFEEKRKKFANHLNSVTSFGLGANFGFNKRDHPVMEDSRWTEIKRARELKEKASRQLGSSGSGNHFADLMTGTVTDNAKWLPLEKGEQFVALVTHSGSRGTGHKLATYYKNIAEQYTQRFSRGITKNYAWLDLDDDAGKEYWQTMQLMGEYASANHELIHHHFSRQAGTELVVSFENHHNFAWKKKVNGKNWIIHRKGATPAEQGVVGIIPGSMGTSSYLVEGKADKKSLWSSSHGAGRVSSRTQAKKDHDAEAYAEYVQEKDILTIGVAKDETYQCYKDIDHIIGLQEDELIEVKATMTPRVVVMGGGRKSDDGD